MCFSLLVGQHSGRFVFYIALNFLAFPAGLLFSILVVATKPFLQVPSSPRQPKFGSLNGQRSKLVAWRPKCFPLNSRKKLQIILATWLKSLF